MVNAKKYNEYEQLAISSQRTLPAYPYPRKYVHSVFDDLQPAMEAVYALRAAGYDAGDISLMASWDFVEAVESEPQQHSRFSEAVMGFLSLFDDTFDVYLHEASRGRHILAVRLSRYGQIEQVRGLLAPYHAQCMKYIDTWTVADLSV